MNGKAPYIIPQPRQNIFFGKDFGEKERQTEKARRSALPNACKTRLAATQGAASGVAGCAQDMSYRDEKGSSVLPDTAEA